MSMMPGPAEQAQACSEPLGKSTVACGISSVASQRSPHLHTCDRHQRLPERRVEYDNGASSASPSENSGAPEPPSDPTFIQRHPDTQTLQCETYDTHIDGRSCSNCGTTRTPVWRRAPTGELNCNACGLYLKAWNEPRPCELEHLKNQYTSAPRQTDRTSQIQDASHSALGHSDGIAFYPTAAEATLGTCPGDGFCNGMGGQESCIGCPVYNNLMSTATHNPNTPAAYSGTTQRPDIGGTFAPHAAGNGGQPRLTAPTSMSTSLACANCAANITTLWRRDKIGRMLCNACGLYQRIHGVQRPAKMHKAEIRRRKRVAPAAPAPAPAPPQTSVGQYETKKARLERELQELQRRMLAIQVEMDTINDTENEGGVCTIAAIIE